MKPHLPIVLDMALCTHGHMESAIERQANFLSGAERHVHG
jgi:hypothetical protein